MSRRKAQGSAARGKGAARRGPAIWTIILVDQEPLRRRAAADCQREMKRLEKARADWHRFEHEDQPAFERWMAQTFGPLMSEMREINAQIHAKEALVDEVEREIYVGNWPSYEAAYRAIMRRREEPPPRSGFADDEPHAGEHHDGRGAAEGGGADRNEFNEFEQELLFDAFVREVMGLDPDRLSESAYRKMFAEFRDNVIGGAGAAERAERERADPRDDPRRHREREHTTEKPSRLKELYRILVRRLHPDTKADTDVQVSALWHEVQEAYGQGNVERLEMLLAFTDLQAEATGEQTTLAQMRAVLAEVRRSLHALLRSLSGAKRQMAWNFAENTNRSAVEQRLRRQMERDVAIRRKQLEELDAFVASWSAPKRKRGGKRKPQGHAEFPF
jgi:hypothetical protein